VDRSRNTNPIPHYPVSRKVTTTVGRRSPRGFRRRGCGMTPARTQKLARTSSSTKTSDLRGNLWPSRDEEFMCLLSVSCVSEHFEDAAKGASQLIASPRRCDTTLRTRTIHHLQVQRAFTGLVGLPPEPAETPVVSSPVLPNWCR